MKNIVFSTAALGMMLVLSGARAEVGPVWQKASIHKASQGVMGGHEGSGDVSLNDVIPVSYTHLTLPTILLV